MRKRILLGAALAIAAALPFAGTASSEPFRLIVTDLEPQLVPNSVMDFAKELGYFDKEGVDVELVRVQQTPSGGAPPPGGDGASAHK
jgi:NitT/TauT family transport system substrate-binding protein